MCLCQSYKGKIKPKCECQSETTYGEHCQKWQLLCFQDGSWMDDFVDADSQLSAHPQGLPFLGHGYGHAPGELRKNPRLGGRGGGRCHCWISGRGGHHGPRFNTQHSGDNSNGSQKLGLLTFSIQCRCTGSLSQKHPHTCCMHA